MRLVIRSIRLARFWIVVMVLTVPMFGCNSDPVEPECEGDPECEDQGELASLPVPSPDGQWIAYGSDRSGEFR